MHVSHVANIIEEHGNERQWNISIKRKSLNGNVFYGVECERKGKMPRETDMAVRLRHILRFNSLKGFLCPLFCLLSKRGTRYGSFIFNQNLIDYTYTKDSFSRNPFFF